MAYRLGFARRPSVRVRLGVVLLLGLLLVLLPINLGWTQDFPALTGRVVDTANLLTSAEEDELSQALAAHEARSTNQIVVVTVESLPR